MTRAVPFLLFLIFFFSTSFAQQKKRVAVMNFEYATVQSSVAAIFGTNTDVGRGIADLLVDKLVEDGVYSVIERKALDKIMAEQNLSNSDRADPNSAAKLGKLLGVDAIIIGSITQFGRDDQKQDISGGALGGLTGRFGIGGVQKTRSKAVVAVTARMVSTDTAEILASTTTKGESTRSGTGLIGSGGSAAAAAGGLYDMRSSNFSGTILGEAVGAAVTSLAKELEARADKLPSKTVKVEGLVADASGGQVILNVGSKAGVKVGDRLEIKRSSREIRDPATGKVIRRIEENVGEVTITEVDEQSAVGKFTGTGTAKVGDVVKSSQ